MAQREHFDATSTPQDIAAAYPAGSYIAQTQGTVLYAAAAAPPADLDDYFSTNDVEGGLFTFTSPGPVWVRTREFRPNVAIAVADYE